MKYKTTAYIVIPMLLSLYSCMKGNTQDKTDNETVQTPDTTEQSIDDKADQNEVYRFSFPENKYPQNYFRNPIDSPILLAGTFCELRNNHFHGGLDIRTYGMEGMPVKSIADGYVSRIKVSPYGYGKALYITHTNGYTSVYGHLSAYSGQIAEYLEKEQYKARNYEVELFPQAGELKVLKGDVVAKSGNTGGSQGPHIHFEIRDPKGRAVNPLLFGLDVKDHISPEISRVILYKKDPLILQEEGGYPYRRYRKSQLRVPLKVQPGTYSFGMFAKDFFTDKFNKLGVNYCWITVNDKLLYHYKIEQMDFDEGRFINTHIDPYLKYATGVNFVRLFKESYNPYPYYRQNHRGEIFLQQGDTANIKLFVSDLAGMKDSVSWIMLGDTNGSNLSWQGAYPFDEKTLIKAGSTGRVNYGNWYISLPQGSFYHDFHMRLMEKAPKSGVLSKVLQMHYGFTPLHTYINVTYRLDESLLKIYGDKLCAVSFNYGRMVYEGGEVSGSNLNFRTRSFGEYAVYYDNKPPRIRPFSLGRNFRIGVSDDLSGIATYFCSVDDKWVLMEYEPKAGTMFGRFPDWVKPGKHQLKIVVVDNEDNRAEYTREIHL